jgi:exo-beta-1,3-glucanase (GH17 family)
MRNRCLAIVAASALLTLTAVGTASAQVVVSSSRIVSNGFTTCRLSRQTDIGPLGSASQSCASGRGFFLSGFLL